MSIQKVFTNIRLNLFGHPQIHQKIISKIVPTSELEDANSDTIANKMLELHTNVNCDFDHNLEYPDLELGFGPVVEINPHDVIVNISIFTPLHISNADYL